MFRAVLNLLPDNVIGKPLYLYGSLELLHLAPGLVVLPADHVDDGAEEGEPHQDEQHRHTHVHRLVRAYG